MRGCKRVARPDDRLMCTPPTAQEGTDGIIRSGEGHDPPSEEVEVVVMPWLYHSSSALSTPPQGWPESPLPHHRNCLQINGKK